MSRNGSGTYTLPAGNPVVTSTTISSTWANNTLADLATAMTGSVASDGQTPITGNLQMGANRITGLADGIASTDAATVSQVTTAVAALGTMSTQNANAVAVTGGIVNGTTIGATTPSSVKTTGLTVTGATSGTLAIAATAIAGTNTATFPAATGTVMVSGNMPVFRVYSNATQSLPSATTTKMVFQVSDFDTATGWNSSTSNYTPNVAGYYQVSLMVRSNTSNSEAQVSVWKNGNSNIGANGTNTSVVAGTAIASGVTAIFYLNGTTDYLTPYVYVGAASTSTTGYQSTYFCGSLIRAA